MGLLVKAHNITRWIKSSSPDGVEYFPMESKCHCYIGADHCELKPKGQMIQPKAKTKWDTIENITTKRLY